jgi:hypothetical protein
MPAIFSRTSTQAQTKVLEKTYYNKTKEIPPLYEKFFNVVTTDSKRSFATWLPLAELGTMSFKPEGQAPTYDQPYELIPYTANFVTYALAVKSTEEADMEDPENFVGRISGQLADSCRETKDLTFWNTLNTGFSGAVLGTDGQPLFSNAHPLGPVAQGGSIYSSIGATYSNTLGSTALTPESLQAMYIQMELMLSDRGMPDRRTPVTCMVVPSMVKIAQEIVGSSHSPFTNTNKINVLHDTVEVVGNRYLTNPNAWFVMAGKGDPFSGGDCHQLFCAFKWDNRFKAWRDPETDNYNQKTSTRFSYGFGGWRGLHGSLGSAGNI